MPLKLRLTDMDSNATQENPVPVKSEKEKSLEAIVALTRSISNANRSIVIVAGLAALAAFGYVYAVMSGLTSPFLLPVIITVMIGNQVYSSRVRNTRKKLEEMKKTHESKFGVVVSS